MEIEPGTVVPSQAIPSRRSMLHSNDMIDFNQGFFLPDVTAQGKCPV